MNDKNHNFNSLIFLRSGRHTSAAEVLYAACWLVGEFSGLLAKPRQALVSMLQVNEIFKENYILQFDELNAYCANKRGKPSDSNSVVSSVHTGFFDRNVIFKLPHFRPKNLCFS